MSHPLWELTSRVRVISQASFFRLLSRCCRTLWWLIGDSQHRHLSPELYFLRYSSFWFNRFLFFTSSGTLKRAGISLRFSLRSWWSPYSLSDLSGSWLILITTRCI